MKKVTITMMAIGLFVLAGCGAPGPELASSAEDIVGMWHRIDRGSPWYILFLEDGALHESTNPELVEDRPMIKAEFWFEGTQLFIGMSPGVCDENPTGIYEVHLLANGNLKFVVIEDECRVRATAYHGRGDTEGLVEFKPVP